MLRTSDIAPIVAALEDQSPAVMEAALRVLSLLAPLVSLEERIVVALERTATDGTETCRALAAQVLAGGSRASSEETIRVPPASSPELKEWSPSRSESRERLREQRFQAIDGRSRLMAARRLAALGEADGLEAAVDALEQGELDFEAIRALREERFPRLPSPLCETFRAIAADDKRRGDVRQVAHLLSGDPGGGPRPPDLALHAQQLADRVLAGRGIGIGYPDIEAFRYLDPERASLLVTVSFQRCVDAAFDRDMPYAVGNDIGRLLEACGSGFVADIPTLIELYMEMSPHATEAWTRYYATQDEDVVFTARSGHIAVGWQIAWTIGRAGLAPVIDEIAQFMDGGDDERIAALHLLEDVIRLLPVPSFPQYGGITAPEMDQAIVVHSIAISTTAAADRYRVVQVFYGTNRERTGSDAWSRYYGASGGPLEVGTCDVSMPLDHQIGSLESPAPYNPNWRSNPSRYIVLLAIARSSRHDFSVALKARVHTSRDKHVLVFVHGYRVSFEDAARRTAQLALDLEIDTPVFFSWPSRARLAHYASDVTMAERSIPRLVEFLDLVSAESGAEVIHLVAHSMGSLALSRAVVEYLQQHPGMTRPNFRELILAAPDIDAEVFRDQIVPKILGSGPRMTLYASRRDYALLVSQWLRPGLARAGLIEDTTPLVVQGVETVDVSAVNTEWFWGLLRGHSYVGDRPAIVQDMSDLLRHGTGAGARFGHRAAFANGLPYWIMKPRSA
jgi:esterase/lipase superfamily enzyme